MVFRKKAWGEAESEQALNGAAAMERCCRSWETCRGSGPHCAEPPGSLWGRLGQVAASSQHYTGPLWWSVMPNSQT